MIFFRDLVVVPQHRRERWLENFFFLSFFSSFRFLLQCHATRLVNRNGIEIGLRREIYRTGASSRAAESYWSLRWARSPSNRIDLYLYILSFASFHSPFKKKKILWGEPQYHFVYNHRTQRGREEMGSMSGTGDDRFSFFFFSILYLFFLFFYSSSIYVISNNNEALVNISVCCVSNSRERTAKEEMERSNGKTRQSSGNPFHPAKQIWFLDDVWPGADYKESSSSRATVDISPWAARLGLAMIGTSTFYLAAGFGIGEESRIGLLFASELSGGDSRRHGVVDAGLAGNDVG